MSLAPRNRAELDKLTKSSKAMFQSQGWDIEEAIAERNGAAHGLIEGQRVPAGPDFATLI